MIRLHSNMKYILRSKQFLMEKVLPHLFISLFQLFHVLQMQFYVPFNNCQIIGGLIFQTCLRVFVHCIKWWRMNISWVLFKSHHCRNARLEVFIKGNAWEVKGEDGGQLVGSQRVKLLWHDCKPFTLSNDFKATSQLLIIDWYSASTYPAGSASRLKLT